MWKHYLTVALRHLRRDPLSSAIDIGGLAVGMAAGLLALVAIWQETHHDRHVPGIERLFLIESKLALPGRDPQILASAPGPLGPLLAANDGRVEALARTYLQWSTVKEGDRSDFNAMILGAEPAFTTIFPFDFLVGDASALADRQSVLLSRSMALRIFGSTGVVGESLVIDDTASRRVAAVFEDWPEASHLDPDIVVPLDSPLITDRRVDASNWRAMGFRTYVRLGDAGDAAQTAKVANRLAAAHMPDLPSFGGKIRAEDYIELALEPVAGLHLNGKTYDGLMMKDVGNAFSLFMLGSVAVLVLLMAAANHVNIALARGSERMHEVALRKVAGALRGRLFRQLLGETAVFGGCAAILGASIAEVLRGPLGDFLGFGIEYATLANPVVAGIALAMVSVTVLAAGTFPAWYLSRLDPTEGLRGQRSVGHRSLGWRSLLTVFQFAVSISLIAAALIVWQQLEYMTSADPGYDRKNIVILHGVRRGPEETAGLVGNLVDLLEAHPSILAAAGSGAVPSWDWNEQAAVRLADRLEVESRALVRIAVDFDFSETYRLRLIAGRDFSAERGPDRAQWNLADREATEVPVILNMTALRTLGLDDPRAAIGHGLSGGFGAGLSTSARIVGVVADFHMKSMRSPVEPLVLVPDPAVFNAVSIRLDPAQREEALAHIRSVWAELVPWQSIAIENLEDALRGQYLVEERQLAIIGILAGLAVLIAALGLFGLSALTVQWRRKEIAVRKIMGATGRDILRLVLWQLLRPAAWANLLAWPAAGWFVIRWLESFAYRVDLTPWPFLAAASGALAIALMTVAGYALRAARTHPAAALAAQ